MALTERNFKILDVLIELTQNMVEGELVQLTKLGRIDLTEQDALELAACKTACLFAGCARLGAVLGNLDDAGEQAMADYGHFAGLAFQLVDDVLDFTASREQLGKPVLSDLKEGKVTLPLIYALDVAWCKPCSMKKDSKRCGPNRSLPWCKNQARWTAREPRRTILLGAQRPA